MMERQEAVQRQSIWGTNWLHLRGKRNITTGQRLPRGNSCVSNVVINECVECATIARVAILHVVIGT